MKNNSEHPVESRCKKLGRSVRTTRPLPMNAASGRAERSWLYPAMVAITLALNACSLAPPPADNRRALQDIAAHNGGAEEVVAGSVIRVLPLHQGPSGVHERFIIDVSAGDTSLPLYVADNVSVGQLAPLHVGDRVTVKGELAFDDLGPLLHWTHRDPRMRHTPGFVMVAGRIYE